MALMLGMAVGFVLGYLIAINDEEKERLRIITKADRHPRLSGESLERWSKRLERLG